MREGILTELIVCESQPENEEKKERERYVQDALKRRADEVYF